MKKVLTMIGLMFFISMPAFALFGLVNQDDIQVIKNEVKANKNENNLIKAEFRGKIVGLEAKIGEVKAQIGGFNKMLTAGGDINDTDLMWNIIYGLMGLLTVAMWRWERAEKRADKSQKESAFFLQQLILKANTNEDVENILKLKDEYFKSKKFMNKAGKTAKKLIDKTATVIKEEG